MELREKIARILSPNLGIKADLTVQCIVNLNKAEEELQNSARKLYTLKTQVDMCSEQLTELRKEINEKSEETELDKYCHEHFEEVPNSNYKSKRDVKSKPISVMINQFIVPNQFEVQKLRKKIPKGETTIQDATNIGTKVSKLLTWTDDKNLATSGDYYLYPEETIVLTKADCEDHSFLVSSLNTEIGVAYGFYNKTIGHAFNVFVDNNKLYILETTGDMTEIYEADKQDKYIIHFILTPTKTYSVKIGPSFGEIAGWN